VVSHATHSTGVGKGLILFPGAILTCFSALGTQPALLDHSSQNMFSASLLDHRNEDTTAESHNHTIPGFCGFPPPLLRGDQAVTMRMVTKQKLAFTGGVLWPQS